MTGVAFLMGFVSALAVAAALGFLSFWRRTRDPLFLWFSGAFLLQAASFAAELRLQHPNAANAVVHGLRFVSYAMILAAIIAKNQSTRRS